MGKIQRCSEITQSRFINLCCLYWSKECDLSYEDAEIEIDKNHLDILISKKIIKKTDEYIFIKFLDEQLKGIIETSKDRSKAANIRWEKYRKNNADALHLHKDALQNDAEKRREEKRREEKENINTIYETFLKEIKAGNFDTRIESLYMRLKIRQGTLTPLLKEFKLHIIEENRFHKNTNDFFINFKNWLNILDGIKKLDKHR